uniref:Uncharacterized protein n=1 Tax=Quercus lobata TaxID=97700 RepID=A0A7N2LJ18_QUELO
MLLVLCPFFHSSHAARDTISQGQSITITETIVSADAKLELGFFRPGNSTYQYVGIWFKKGMPKNIVIGSHVWVGDPELIWIDGQIINVNGEEAKIQTGNGKTILFIGSHSILGRAVVVNANPNMIWKHERPLF